MRICRFALGNCANRRDLRFGCAPLALGIGAQHRHIQLIQRLFMRSLPFREADRPVQFADLKKQGIPQFRLGAALHAFREAGHFSGFAMRMQRPAGDAHRTG